MAGTVLVPDTLAPNVPNAYPVVEDLDGKGGFISVANIAARDALLNVNPVKTHGKPGMWVFTRDSGTYWKLELDGSTWTAVVFGGSGSSISVANVAALEATDDSLFPDGSLAYVSTFRDFFELNKNDTTTPADGVTVIESFDGARWFRCDIHSLSWAFESDIYIDNDALGIGNDENDGLTALTPLKTHAEWERRLGDNACRQNTTVHYLSAHTPAVTVNARVGSTFTYKEEGIATPVLTGTITSYTAQTGNAQYSFNDTAFGGSWSTHYGRRITLTSGVNSGAFAWIGYDLQTGDPVTTKWRKYTANGALDSTNRPPTLGDSYKIETLTAVNMTLIDTSADPLNGTAGSSVQFYNLKPTGPGLVLSVTAKGALPLFVGCDMGSIPFVATKAQFVLCGFLNGTYTFGGGESNIYGGLVRGIYGILADQNATVNTFDGPLLNGSTGIYAKAGAVIEINGCSFLRTIAGVLGQSGSHITIDPGAIVTFPQKWQAGADIVFGTDAVRRFVTNRGGNLVQKTPSAQTAVGSLTSPDGDYEFGTSDQGFSFDDSIPAAGPVFTMTHALLAANNDNAHSFKLNAHIYKV